METIKKEIRLEYRKLRKGGSDEAWSEFLIKMKNSIGEDQFKAIAKSVFNDNDEARKRLRNYTQSDLFRNRIRKYCNYHGYSDIDPCEVIEVVSPRKIIVRQMDAVLTQSPVQHIGGFCANTENDTQRWECKSNESNQTIVLTLTKKGWGQGQYRMSDSPRKFYDYNF